MCQIEVVFCVELYFLLYSFLLNIDLLLNKISQSKKLSDVFVRIESTSNERNYMDSKTQIQTIGCFLVTLI
jgi:hypothetical protein